MTTTKLNLATKSTTTATVKRFITLIDPQGNEYEEVLCGDAGVPANAKYGVFGRNRSGKNDAWEWTGYATDANQEAKEEKAKESFKWVKSVEGRIRTEGETPAPAPAPKVETPAPAPAPKVEAKPVAHPPAPAPAPAPAAKPTPPAPAAKSPNPAAKPAATPAPAKPEASLPLFPPSRDEEGNEIYDYGADSGVHFNAAIDAEGVIIVGSFSKYEYAVAFLQMSMKLTADLGLLYEVQGTDQAKRIEDLAGVQESLIALFGVKGKAFTKNHAYILVSSDADEKIIR